MKVESLAIAPECGRNHHPLASYNKAHVARKGLVEDRVRECCIKPPTLKPEVTPGRGMVS